ncbi:MarR family winged helix-turn-helix transcriptional regulator [Zoogloea dura]|uniref:MarR family transcriptional regulator n=1 Tax=Zoogloea dura TaxID=2728840 RepID=A0A848G1V8_9RHOO|nr:MarR family transcriptional regulator [Zoogloea dura]NML25129.1 MarR family transcriptional regulator [Zoogloea dura]
MIDLSRQAKLREAIELFFFAYRAFTAPPDRILAERGLGRVHHRILYFVARQPGTTVTELLGTLGVTKQALNAPLRQLQEAGLVVASVGEHDRRMRRLELTGAGVALEAELSGTQLAMLADVFEAAGGEGGEGEAAWRAVMTRLAGMGQEG